MFLLIEREPDFDILENREVIEEGGEVGKEKDLFALGFREAIVGGTVDEDFA